MDRAVTILRLGALLGLTGVAAGAFGAHALREWLSPYAQEIWRTAVFYQLVHAVALLGVAALTVHGGVKAMTRVATLFALGVLVFSGSLYLLAVTGVRTLGAITPLGGLALLAGWLVLLFGVSARNWSAD